MCRVSQNIHTKVTSILHCGGQSSYQHRKSSQIVNKQNVEHFN